MESKDEKDNDPNVDINPQEEELAMRSLQELKSNFSRLFPHDRLLNGLAESKRSREQLTEFFEEATATQARGALNGLKLHEGLTKQRQLSLFKKKTRKLELEIAQNIVAQAINLTHGITTTLSQGAVKRSENIKIFQDQLDDNIISKPEFDNKVDMVTKLYGKIDVKTVDALESVVDEIFAQYHSAMKTFTVDAKKTHDDIIEGTIVDDIDLS